MLRYWYDEETDDYGVSTNRPEADGFIAIGYKEISREEFDVAMHKLKD